MVAVQAAAVPLVSALAAGGDIAAAALPWVRIAIIGVPAILISAAGNGWMRGVQDTARPLRYVVTGFAVSAVLCPLLVYGWLGMPRLELAGSAVANLVGQWLAALMFCRALLVERVSAARPADGVARPGGHGSRSAVADVGVSGLLRVGRRRRRAVRRGRRRRPSGGAAAVEFPCAGAGFVRDCGTVAGGRGARRR